MEFPFGHHSHHQRHEEEEEEARAEHGRHHFAHFGHEHPPPPAPPAFGAEGEHGRLGYPHVEHVSHECGHDPRQEEPHLLHPPSGYYGGGGEGPPHHHRPAFFPGAHHAEGHGSHSGDSALSNQRTVRVFTKAEPNYSLSIRDGKVILARSDPKDPYQHWIRDLRYSTKVKDEEGLPSFALINKATGEAIKHSIGATQPVRLVSYNPDYLDESVLWTESNDTGENFRCIRMVNNIRLNFDAFHGDKDHGGVKDGTIVVLWEWLKGDNQRWKIVSYCKFYGQVASCRIDRFEDKLLQKSMP